MKADPAHDPPPPAGPPGPGGGVLLLNWRDTGHPEGGGSEIHLERIAAGLARGRSRCSAPPTRAPRPASSSTASTWSAAAGASPSTCTPALWPGGGAGTTWWSTCRTACPSCRPVLPAPGGRPGPPRPPGAVAGGLAGPRPGRLVDRVPGGAAGLPALPLRDGLPGDPDRPGPARRRPRAGHGRLQRAWTPGRRGAGLAAVRGRRAWWCSAGWCPTSGSRSRCGRSPSCGPGGRS